MGTYIGEQTVVHCFTPIKSNDPACNPIILTFNKYEVEELCVYGHMKDSLSRAYLKGANPAVFTMTRSLHEAASQETLSRYVQTTMTEATIKMRQFTPYTCRHASTITAWRKHLPIITILTVVSLPHVQC